MYILICDDEPAVARQVEQLARQHLEQRGIPVQCTVCTRGEEALARSASATSKLRSCAWWMRRPYSRSSRSTSPLRLLVSSAACRAA